MDEDTDEWCINTTNGGKLLKCAYLYIEWHNDPPIKKNGVVCNRTGYFLVCGCDKKILEYTELLGTSGPFNQIPESYTRMCPFKLKAYWDKRGFKPMRGGIR
jgi:hypothetical protein